MLEIIHNLGRSLDAAVFLPNILDSLFEIFPQAERGYVLLVNPADGQLLPQAIKHRRGEPGSSLTFGPISRAVANRVMTAGEAILSTDADQGDNSSILDSGNSSTMTVPLMGPSRQPLGLLHLEATDRERRFMRADLEVLWSVGTVTGQAVEFARVHEARLTFDRRQRELDTAREVQLHFLPHMRPEVPGYCFFDYYQAAEDVGGDYFGYIPLADGRLAIAVGDVSGKGVSAALLMARLCSEVRYCLAICPSAVEAVERMNQELANTTQNDRFVTFLLCVLDPAQSRAGGGQRGPPFPAPLPRPGGGEAGAGRSRPAAGARSGAGLYVVHHRDRRERHHRAVYRRHQRSPLAARHHLWLAPAGSPAGRRPGQCHRDGSAFAFRRRAIRPRPPAK